MSAATLPATRYRRLTWADAAAPGSVTWPNILGPTVWLTRLVCLVRLFGTVRLTRSCGPVGRMKRDRLTKHPHPLARNARLLPDASDGPSPGFTRPAKPSYLGLYRHPSLGPQSCDISVTARVTIYAFRVSQ